jgi:hypothetical protein
MWREDLFKVFPVSESELNPGVVVNATADMEQLYVTLLYILKITNSLVDLK